MGLLRKEACAVPLFWAAFPSPCALPACASCGCVCLGAEAAKGWRSHWVLGHWDLAWVLSQVLKTLWTGVSEWQLPEVDACLCCHAVEAILLEGLDSACGEAQCDPSLASLPVHLLVLQVGLLPFPALLVGEANLVCLVALGAEQVADLLGLNHHGCGPSHCHCTRASTLEGHGLASECAARRTHCGHFAGLRPHIGQQCTCSQALCLLFSTPELLRRERLCVLRLRLRTLQCPCLPHSPFCAIHKQPQHAGKAKSDGNVASKISYGSAGSVDTFQLCFKRFRGSLGLSAPVMSAAVA